MEKKAKSNGVKETRDRRPRTERSDWLVLESPRQGNGTEIDCLAHFLFDLDEDMVDDLLKSRKVKVILSKRRTVVPTALAMAYSLLK
jgi:hypothetical protein